MRLHVAGVETERGFKVLPSARKIAVFEKHIAQVHAAHGIAGMARHGLQVGRPCGRPISRRVQQRPQIVQCQPVRGLARQHLEIRLSGFQSPAHLGEQTGQLESQTHRVGLGRDAAVQIAQKRIPGRVAAANPRPGQDCS